MRWRSAIPQLDLLYFIALCIKTPHQIEGLSIMSALQVTGIDHVTLVVADLERSRKFYCDVLGMHVVPRPGFNFPGSWFQIGNQQIHLIEAHEGSAPAGFPAPAEYV